MTTIHAVVTKLKKMNACEEALIWLEAQPDLETAWNTCQRGDWMLWLLGRQGGETGSEKRRKVALAACECARLSLHLVTAGELRPLKAIETTEAWARGDNSVTLLDAAYAAYTRFASYAAANAASAAASAAANAAYAAYAASAAAYAAANAAATAASAAANAASAAAYAAKEQILAQCADIVRKHYPGYEVE